MAGGNLSPRQKMINMMYLVLTALLALNVSAEILDAFESLRNSLAASAESFREKNVDTKKSIEAKVQEEVGQGNTKNEELLKWTAEVEGKTMEMIAFLNTQVEALEKIAEVEKDEKTGEKHLVNMKETEKNYQHWMGAGKEQANGGRGGGAAMELRDKFNGFIEWSKGFVNSHDSTGKAVEEMKFTPLPDKLKTHDGDEKPWEYVSFHGKPVVADLAILEKFKMDVYEVQSELLNFIKARLGAVTFKIDSLMLVDAPVSRVVAAGMKFETKLFVAATSKEAVPEFTGSGTIEKVDGGYAANMSMTAQGGFAKGQNEKEVSYVASAKVPDAFGGFKQLKLEGKYTVRKPEVVITSASVQNLYYNCGNTINVDVPALGDLYNPKFTASNASVIPSSSDKKKVTIVPTGKTCVLGVSSFTNNQNIKIDDVKYNVIKPPKPDIKLIVNGKEYNGASPISKKSNCTVRLSADSDFKAALPKDARYMITSVDLLSQRSLGAPSKVGSYSGNGKDALQGIPVALGNKLKSDPPGTKIFFKIDKIYRVNFQNKKIEENFGERDLTIGALIK